MQKKHTSLLIILCIIVYVTNKAHLSIICLYYRTYCIFFSTAISKCVKVILTVTVYHYIDVGLFNVQVVVAACSCMFYLYILVGQLLHSFHHYFQREQCTAASYSFGVFQHLVNGWDADCLDVFKDVVVLYKWHSLSPLVLWHCFLQPRCK